MQLISADATIFKKKIAPENMKKLLSKVSHNQPQFFFSVLQTSPKPALISDIFHKNLPLRDFSIMTLPSETPRRQFVGGAEETHLSQQHPSLQQQ